MFERYNEKARMVVFYARHFATTLKRRCIEPEHILLAILQEDAELIQQWVKAEEAERLRIEVEQAGQGAEETSASRDMYLSYPARRVLAFGAEEAERLGHEEIRPVHLLAGILREHNTPAAVILRRFGVDVQQTRVVFVASSNAPTDPAELEELHCLVDRLPKMQWGRAKLLLHALIGADRKTG